MLFSQSFKFFTKFDESRLICMIKDSCNKIYLDLLSFFLRISAFIYEFINHIGIKAQYFFITMDFANRHVLMNQFNGLWSESVPYKFSCAIGRFDGLINFRKPLVISYIWFQEIIWRQCIPCPI